MKSTHLLGKISSSPLNIIGIINLYLSVMPSMRFLALLGAALWVGARGSLADVVPELPGLEGELLSKNLGAVVMMKGWLVTWFRVNDGE